MFKKNAFEKRLRKISKQEAANVRLLEKQELELQRALDENEKLIERGLSKQGPGEIKVTQEIEKLTKRLTQLNSELDKVWKF